MLSADIGGKSYRTDHLTGEDCVRGTSDPRVPLLLRGRAAAWAREPTAATALHPLGNPRERGCSYWADRPPGPKTSRGTS